MLTTINAMGYDAWADLVVSILTDNFPRETVEAILEDGLSLRNQNHATAVWLDAGKGVVTGGNEQLQRWLEATCGGAKSSGGAVSPVAASTRVTYQASNQDGWDGKVYHVAARDRCKFPVVRHGRGGAVTARLKIDPADLRARMNKAYNG